MITNLTKNYTKHGFTIVELLVVIVVIGILAAITITSYSGISGRAIAASLQTDLNNSSKQLKLYSIIHGSYPTSLNASNCPATPIIDNTYCLKNSNGNTYTNYVSDGVTFSLTENNSNGMSYSITDNNIPTNTAASLYQNWTGYPQSPELTSAYPYQVIARTNDDTKILIISSTKMYFDGLYINTTQSQNAKAYLYNGTSWGGVWQTFTSLNTLWGAPIFVQANSILYSDSGLATTYFAKTTP